VRPKSPVKLNFTGTALPAFIRFLVGGSSTGANPETHIPAAAGAER
jgi:hypothetical protein